MGCLQGFWSANSGLRISKGRHSTLFWDLLPLVLSATSSVHFTFGLPGCLVSSHDWLKITSVGVILRGSSVIGLIQHSHWVMLWEFVKSKLVEPNSSNYNSSNYELVELQTRRTHELVEQTNTLKYNSSNYKVIKF